MDYTARTREWLDQRVAATVRGAAPRPSYYDRSGVLSGLPIEHVLGLARALVILERLSSVSFETCLDVGAGTGWLTHLIREHCAARTATVDLSLEFSSFARTGLRIPSYVANAAALPFADRSFDVVVCSEVIEHVEHPLAVLGELRRVARRAVIVTTQETCLHDWQRCVWMAAAADFPHAERNYFLPADFLDFFGGGVELRPLMSIPERLRLFELDSVEHLGAAIMEITRAGEIGRGSYGLMASLVADAARRAPSTAKRELLESILEADRAIGGGSGFRADWSPTPRGILPGDPAELRCPACLGRLEREKEALRCAQCPMAYPLDRGVPVLLAGEEVARDKDAAQRARPELARLARAMERRPWRSRRARQGARTAMRVHEFLRLPLGCRDKARLAWKVLVS